MDYNFNMHNRELQLEANEKAKAAQQLSVPSAPVETANKSNRTKIRSSIASIPSSDSRASYASALSETEELHQQILKFKQYLEHAQRRPSISAATIVVPSESGEEVADEAQYLQQLAHLRAQVDSVLERAEYRTKRITSETIQNTNEQSSTAIIETPSGSPNIQIETSKPEDIWTTIPSGARPHRTNTQVTLDSAIGGMSDRGSVSSTFDALISRSGDGAENPFKNPWAAREHDPNVPSASDRSPSISSAISASTFGSGWSSDHQPIPANATTPGTTPLHSPLEWRKSPTNTSMQPLQLTPAALSWELISESATV
jgi:hypothetical protein